MILTPHSDNLSTNKTIN